MGIFGLINAFGNAVIPQIGWLYTFPMLALKNMPIYLIENIPENYPLRGFYVNISSFIDQLIDIATNLPAVGGYIDSMLSITPMQLILPATILAVIQILLLVKLIKLLADIIPL